MADYRFIVFTNAIEGRQADFNQWYDEQHLSDVLAVPGFIAAQRFQAHPARGTPSHQYMTIYEISTHDIEAVFADLALRSRTDRMPISDALDAEALSFLYEATASRRCVPAVPQANGAKEEGDGG